MHRLWRHDTVPACLIEAQYVKLWSNLRVSFRARVMTSPFLDRVNQHDKWYKADDCIFCDIISGNKEAYVVAETDMYMAFLDILPIRAGM